MTNHKTMMGLLALIATFFMAPTAFAQELTPDELALCDQLGFNQTTDPGGHQCMAEIYGRRNGRAVGAVVDLQQRLEAAEQRADQAEEIAGQALDTVEQLVPVLEAETERADRAETEARDAVAMTDAASVQRSVQATPGHMGSGAYIPPPPAQPWEMIWVENRPARIIEFNAMGQPTKTMTWAECYEAGQCFSGRNQTIWYMEVEGLGGRVPVYQANSRSPLVQVFAPWSTIPAIPPNKDYFWYVPSNETVKGVLYCALDSVGGGPWTQHQWRHYPNRLRDKATHTLRTDDFHDHRPR